MKVKDAVAAELLGGNVLLSLLQMFTLETKCDCISSSIQQLHFAPSPYRIVPKSSTTGDTISPYHPYNRVFPLPEIPATQPYQNFNADSHV